MSPYDFIVWEEFYLCWICRLLPLEWLVYDSHFGVGVEGSCLRD